VEFYVSAEAMDEELKRCEAELATLAGKRGPDVADAKDELEGRIAALRSKLNVFQIMATAGQLSLPEYAERIRARVVADVTMIKERPTMPAAARALVVARAKAQKASLVEVQQMLAESGQGGGTSGGGGGGGGAGAGGGGGRAEAPTPAPAAAAAPAPAQAAAPPTAAPAPTPVAAPAAAAPAPAPAPTPLLSPPAATPLPPAAALPSPAPSPTPTAAAQLSAEALEAIQQYEALLKDILTKANAARDAVSELGFVSACRSPVLRARV
jgi:hypothetical protein